MFFTKLFKKIFSNSRVRKINPKPKSLEELQIESKARSFIYNKYGYVGTTSLSNLFKVFPEVSKECQVGPIDINLGHAETDVLLISKTQYIELLELAIKGTIYENNKNN